MLERQRVSSRAVLVTFCNQQTITWCIGMCLPMVRDPESVACLFGSDLLKVSESEAGVALYLLLQPAL